MTMPETTQSDLVERLTGMADLYRRAISDDNEDAQTFADAADEITRLRRENQLMREALEADCTAFAAMEEKLITVANRISGPRGGKPCHPDPAMLSEWVAEINHAALADLRKDTPA